MGNTNWVIIVHLPDNRDAAVQIIGKGFNLITKESAAEDVFEHDETRRTDFGIAVPSSAKSSAYCNISIRDTVKLSAAASLHATFSPSLWSAAAGKGALGNTKPATQRCS